MKNENLECPACGESKLKSKTIHHYEYRTLMGMVTIQGDCVFNNCASCNETLIPGALIDKQNLQILSQLAKRTAILSPNGLKFVFSILPYSQSEIAEATGIF